jgi:hypothetical protein
MKRKLTSSKETITKIFGKCISVLMNSKKGYQPQADVIKKDDGTIVADTTSILITWEQFYSNLLNVNQSTDLEESKI